MITISKKGKRTLYILREIDIKGKVLRECGQAFMMFDQDLKNQQLLVFSSGSALQPSTDNSTTIQAVRYHKPWNKAAKTLTINTNNIETCAEGAVSFIRFPGKNVSKYQLMCSRKINPVEYFQTKTAHAVVFDGQGTRDLKFTLDESGNIQFNSKRRFNMEKLNGAPIMWKVPWLHIGSEERQDQVIGLLLYDNHQLHPVFFELDTFTQMELSEHDQRQQNHVQGQEEDDENSDMPSTSSQDSSKFSAQDMELYSKNLKSTIKRQTEFQPKFMASSFLSCAKTDDIFTNLLIYRGQKPLQTRKYSKPIGTPIKACQDLFIGPEGDASNPKSILAIGKPGIGKTLFCQKLVRDWANDVLFHNESSSKTVGFDFVYLLTFRQLSRLGEKELNLREVLNNSPPYHLNNDKSIDGSIDESLFEHLIKHQERVLFILDGYDEYAHRKSIHASLREETYDSNPRCRMPVPALLSQLMKKKVFCDATIMVTSRPQARDELGGIDFGASVEIAGFSPEQVKEFILKYFLSKPPHITNRVCKHIMNNENLLSIAHIPMLCFLMCWCLDLQITFNSGNNLPNTITGLYSKVVELFEMKHHSKSPFRTAQIPEQLEVVPSVVKVTLQKLSKLAAGTLVEMKFNFQERDLKGYSITPEETDALKASGLLTCAPGLSETSPPKITRDYCFSHSTLHEYFAACQFVKNDEIPYKLKRSSMVFTFMAGLLGEKKDKKTMELLMQAVILENDFVLSAKCLYEYLDEEFGFKMISKYHHCFCTELEGSCLLSGSTVGLSDVDCAALSYFFNLISEFNRRNKEQENKTASPKTFHINGLQCIFHTATGAKRICEALQNPFCPITSLECYKINDECLECLMEALPSTNITTLSLYHPHIAHYIGLKHFCEALVSTKITNLCLALPDISDVVLQNIIKGIPSTETALTLRVPVMSDERMQCFCEILAATNITTLDCRLSNLCTDRALQYLSQALPSSNVTTLSISAYNMTDVGLHYLSDVLPLTGITSFCYEDNKIHRGLKYFIEKLPSTTINSLKLGSSMITEVGLQYLCEILPSTSITTLLTKTKLSKAGLQHLIKMLPSTAITTFGIYRESYAYEVDANELLQCLSMALPSTKITTLILESTYITDVGLQYLSKSLPSTNITTLKLYCGEVTDQGLLHLSKALSLAKVTTLKLGSKSQQITNTGLQHLCKALQSSTVTKLDLSGIRGSIDLTNIGFLSELLPSMKIILYAARMYTLLHGDSDFPQWP